MTKQMKHIKTQKLVLYSWSLVYVGLTDANKRTLKPLPETI